MKKIFTLAFVVLATMSASAQSLPGLSDINTYEVHMPQAVYDNVGASQDPILYAWRYVKTNDNSDTYAKVDAASQVVKFEMRNDSLVKVGEQNAFIGLGAADGYFYGYGDTVAIYNKVKDTVPTPLSTANVVKYTMAYNDVADEASEKSVRVVFEGDKVYFADFDESQPDLWFCGTLNGDDGTKTVKKVMVK